MDDVLEAVGNKAHGAGFSENLALQALEEIWSSHEFGPAPTLSKTKASWLTAEDWQRGHAAAMKAIAEKLQVLNASTGRRGGGAWFVSLGLDLAAFGIDAYLGGQPRPRARVERYAERMADEAASFTEKLVRRTLKAVHDDMVSEAKAESQRLLAEAQAFKEELYAERSAFEDERQMLITAADASSAEAHVARKEAVKARADLQAAKEQHLANSRKNRDLAAEEIRRAKAEAKASWKEVSKLREQLLVAQADLDALRTALAQSSEAEPQQPAAAPKTTPLPAANSPKPAPAKAAEAVDGQVALPTALERLSLLYWARTQGLEAFLSGDTVHYTTGVDALAEWQRAVPTPERMRVQVWRDCPADKRARVTRGRAA